MSCQQPDEPWVEAARRGDVQAFNGLVERYQQLVYNLGLRMLDSSAAAEDATQEAFLSAYRHLGRFRGGNFRAWLMRIAANACYDELRRRGRRPERSLDALYEGSDAPPVPAGKGGSPDAYALRRESQRNIQTALARLPQEQRLAVILCDVQGLRYEEIAVTMGTTLGTVKSRISRARAHLRALLTAGGELRAAAIRQDKGTMP